MLELHFLVMTSLRRESLAPELLSLLPPAMGGGSVIKMAPVMGLITLIVSNTWLSFQMLLPRPEERQLD